jgi:hypothetical protein
MKILGCLPKYRMFFIGVTEKEYQDQIAPLMATLRLQHRDDYAPNYVSSQSDVDYDLKENKVRQDDKEDAYREALVDQFGIEENEFPRFFLINRSLTKCFSEPPDYPFCSSWNGHSPLREMDQILNVSNLLEVASAPMTWNGKPRKEGYEPRGPLQQQSYVESVKADIEKLKKDQVPDQQILESIRNLYMMDEIDDETVYELNHQVGYGLRTSWYDRSWPDRKIYSVEDSLIRYADGSNAMSLEEAACHIDDYRSEGLSDKQILFTVCGFYMKDQTTDQSLELFFKCLDKPLPEHFKQAKTAEQKKEAVKEWLM